jgi:hypothetical protein
MAWVFNLLQAMAEEPCAAVNYYKAVKRVVDADSCSVSLKPLVRSEEYDYRVGKTYVLSEHEEPAVGKHGFHACLHPAAILMRNFGYDKNDALLQVTLHGEVIMEECQCAASAMTVLKEVSWSDAFEACGGLQWTDPSTMAAYTFDHEGNLHSWDDIAAVRQRDDSEKWWFHGKLHRDEDKPAWVTRTESRWYNYGKLHRADDKPAIVGTDKLVWYVHGRPHREGAPAWLNLKTNTSLWFRNGQLHCDNDKPAWASNEVFKWYRHGLLHRECDQPAAVFFSGRKEWYWNGHLHRGDDKHAIEDGTRRLWYVHGQFLKEEDDDTMF